MNPLKLRALPLIGSVLILAAAIPASALQERWLSLRSQNFIIVTNAGEKEAQVLAERLETFRYVISTLFNINAGSAVPTRVMAFNGDSSFATYKPVYQNRLEQRVAGYFLGGEDENLIALNVFGNYSALALIFHEYTHLLISQGQAQWPLWLDEGLAEFYSTFRVEKKDVSLGVPVSSHVLYLRRQQLMPLANLFAVDYKSPDYHEGERQGVFYAESWALVHYLLMGDNSSHQPQFVHFIKMLISGEKVETAFTAAFETSFAEMEKALARYVQKNKYQGVTYTLDASPLSDHLTARPISNAEAQFYLGDLLLRWRRVEEAEDRFMQAAIQDPGLGLAYQGLGMTAMYRHNEARAIDQFKKALELDGTNYLAHYYYARTLWESAPAPESKLAEEVRREIRKSVRLMPALPGPYALLAEVSLRTRDGMDEGVIAISNAIKLAPRMKWYKIRLAELQARLNRLDDARKTLDPLLNDTSDSGIQKAARSILNSIGQH